MDAMCVSVGPRPRHMPSPLIRVRGTDQVVVLPQGTKRDARPAGAGDIFGVHIRRVLCPRNSGLP